MSHTADEQRLRAWATEQDLLESIVQKIAKLNRDKGVLLRLFGRPLLGNSVVDLREALNETQSLHGDEITLDQLAALVDGLIASNVKPARIDLGLLSRQVSTGNQTNDAAINSLVDQTAGNDNALAPRDVALFGFGRIGRLMARQMIERAGPANALRLRAIVVRPAKDRAADLEKRAALLRRDSIHGDFNASVVTDHESHSLICNGTRVALIEAQSPEDVDYKAHGLSDVVVVDNTGAFRDEAGLGRHLAAKGATKVLLTAPGKGEIKNVVYGVNDSDILPGDQILSAASCTTNAIAPVLSLLDQRIGIEAGHVETVHSYTNDQNLTDNYHKAERRGRAAPLNMVITSTGAASAVAKAYPPLKGKLTGNAIRVPTPNVSLAILNLTLNAPVTVEGLNKTLFDASVATETQKQIGYMASTELVSSDLNGSRYAGIVDSAATICDDNRCVLYVWYDNEFGYACQVYRVMQKMAGVELMTLPKVA